MPATRTHRHSCLLTRDDRDDANRERDEHAAQLARRGLARQYCLHVEHKRGTWQLWLYEYDRGDDDAQT